MFETHEDFSTAVGVACDERSTRWSSRSYMFGDPIPFVPLLTVLAEVGGRFIWLVRRPEEGGVGPCLCDSMGWDESYPLSEGLAHKFSNRALDFDNLPQLVSLPMLRRSMVTIEFRASGASHA